MTEKGGIKMKKQIRFTLLFALAVLLAFSALAAIPFSALANEQYTLTIYAVVLNGNEMPPEGITDYGSIRISDNTGTTLLEGDGATISYHLSILKKADLVSEKKVKNFIYYQLNASVFEEILLWLSQFQNQPESDKSQNKENTD